MKQTTIALTLALAFGLAATGSAHAQQKAPLNEASVRSHLSEQGYSKIHDIKFKDGMWRAEADAANGNSVDLRIDPKSGKAYPDENDVARITESDVRASLSTSGYTDVHDVHFDDGMYSAKAKNKAGQKVELQIDPNSGKIVGTDD